MVAQSTLLLESVPLSLKQSASPIGCGGLGIPEILIFLISFARTFADIGFHKTVHIHIL